MWRSADGGGRGAQTGAGGKACAGHVSGVGRRGFVSSLVTSPAEALLVGGGVLNCARWSFRLVGAVAGGSCVRCARREDEEEEECGSGTLQVRAADKELSEWGLSLPYQLLLLPSCPCFVESMGRTRAELAASASWQFRVDLVSWLTCSLS